MYKVMMCNIQVIALPVYFFGTFLHISPNITKY